MSEETRKRILFVDDERNVLDAIRRMLHGMKDIWKMEFVTKGSDALMVMESQSYDVVITDLRMPDIDGLKLLEEIREKYPNTIRFILSGYTDQPLQGIAARCVHQFIPKPCNAIEIRELVDRAFRLHDRLHSDKIMTTLSNINSLPVLPKAYQEVLDLLDKPACSLRQIGNAVAKDIGLSTKILQVVNCSFAGQNKQISDPVHAVTFLGQKSAEALILSSGIFSELPIKLIRQFGIDGLQEHSMRVGNIAKEICLAMEMDPDDAETASMAGILHDAGKMILISQFPDQYWQSIEKSRKENIQLIDLEKEIIGASHADLGGYLLELWGLPNSIIESTTFHHEPKDIKEQQFSITTAVHIADALDRMICNQPREAYSSSLNKDYLQQMNAREIVNELIDKYVPGEFRDKLYV